MTAGFNNQFAVNVWEQDHNSEMLSHWLNVMLHSLSKIYQDKVTKIYFKKSVDFLYVKIWCAKCTTQFSCGNSFLYFLFVCF